eukprot:CAMPEP_0114133636 /NCGR_PEP_ID=MMETSP0043_2-20121206/13737_1 /TAXON_ID=464988 /ORGANISM="Hemiselmis andersenii, Strain CCMP644" /LENGTH=310 /DNA_ID=CAMNT_0001227237 /DNA_START=101 /DNA_END=1030 /DNA_ORIENTATION=+
MPPKPAAKAPAKAAAGGAKPAPAAAATDPNMKWTEANPTDQRYTSNAEIPAEGSFAFEGSRATRVGQRTWATALLSSTAVYVEATGDPDEDAARRGEGLRYASMGTPGSPLKRKQILVMADRAEEGETKRGLRTAMLEAAIGSMMLKMTELYRRGRQDALPSKVKGASSATSSTTKGDLTPQEQLALEMLERHVSKLVKSGRLGALEAELKRQGKTLPWKASAEEYWDRPLTSPRAPPSPSKRQQTGTDRAPSSPGAAAARISTPDELREQHPGWEDFSFGKMQALLDLLPPEVRMSAAEQSKKRGKRLT